MGAKDTIMSYAQEKIIKDRIEQVHKEKMGYSGINWGYTQEDRDIIRRQWEQEILETQAEISFKAGQQDQAALDQINFDKERSAFWRKISEAKQAGIKEVVEWIGDYDKPFPNQRDWKDKLKEWGIGK